ncbi:MAG: thiamine phosphate synthase [Oceanospirillaceae bacterium]|nr:thiamine phosphate synthase [Oceanospirillaceae bacterium]
MRCGKRCCDAIVLGLSYLEQISQHYLQAHPLQPANFSPLYYSESWQKEAPNAFSWPVTLAYFPNLKTALNTQALASFNKTDTLALGLYPVIDSLAWLEKLLVLGIKTIQLRIKEVPAPELDSIVAKAAALGKHYNARLFINDHWQLAIKHQCYGVHLGQEDITESNLEAIQQAGLRLGVSTHSEYEWLRAISIQPSYIAMGTVYPTNTKPAILIGLSNLKNWCQTLAEHYPVVAIGGIKLENIDIVLNTGVRSIALVTAITEAAEYKTATRLLVAKLESDPA